MIYLGGFMKKNNVLTIAAMIALLLTSLLTSITFGDFEYTFKNIYGA